MAPTSRLGRQLQEILAGLDRVGAEGALIGGLAMAPHNVVRATRDIDLLADARLLAAAQPRATVFGTLRVISLEGLVAFKLQDLANDPRRT